MCEGQTQITVPLALLGRVVAGRLALLLLRAVRVVAGRLALLLLRALLLEGLDQLRAVQVLPVERIEQLVSRLTRLGFERSSWLAKKYDPIIANVPLN